MFNINATSVRLRHDNQCQLHSQLKPHTLITAGLHNGSKIVNGDSTLLVFYKN